jgi:hypothetical protein
MKTLATTIALLLILSSYCQESLIKFNTYKPSYTPMTKGQMEAVAFNRAVEAAKNEKNYNYYKDLAIKNADKGDYETCIYYAKAAYDFGYVSADLLYYEGVSYYILEKKKKYKKVIKKAKKNKYFDVVKYLKELDE